MEARMLLLKLLDSLEEEGWTVYASFDQKATSDNDTMALLSAKGLGERDPSLPQLRNIQRHKVVAIGMIWRRYPGRKCSDTKVLDYPTPPVP